MISHDKQYDFIQNEINFSFEALASRRKIALEYLRVYMAVLIGLFSYTYFIESRLVLNDVRTDLPDKDYIVFGLFGIIITSIVFIIGWALLDNVTKTVFNSIVHKKHISYMRNMLGETFDGDYFKRNSILPLKQKKIEMRISAQVAVIAGCVHFGLLLFIYYYLSLFNDSNISLILTCFIISIISLFYSNLLEKHFEEILIAQKIIPGRSSNEVKGKVERFIERGKKQANYIYTKRLYKVLMFIQFLMIILLMLFEKKIDNIEVLIYLPIAFFFITIVPRYFMGVHRIKQISCFPFSGKRYPWQNHKSKNPIVRIRIFLRRTRRNKKIEHLKS